MATWVSPIWAALNLGLALMIATELRYQTITFHYLRLIDRKHSHPGFHMVLAVLLIVLVLNFLSHLRRYLFPQHGREDLTLTERQMSLMRVARTDPGFKLSPVKSESRQSRHPNPFSPPREGSFLMR